MRSLMLAAVLAAAVLAARPATVVPPKVVVYKSATCGCCAQWVAYMRRSGFTVEVHDVDNLAEIGSASGVPDAAASCHVAQVGGYVVVGHVPVETIRRLLREQPDIIGVSVPGMVVGSPGMEQGIQRPHYDVVAIARDGRITPYERH